MASADRDSGMNVFHDDTFPGLSLEKWGDGADLGGKEFAAGALPALPGSDFAIVPGPDALLPPDFVPGDVSSTFSIAIGSSADVVIETIGDHDWYRLSLTAGVSYTIQTSFDETATDAYLNLRDGGGAILASDDDAGEVNNSLITYTPTVSGTYFIDAGTYNNDTTGSFHLFVAPILTPGDSVGGSIGSASSLALGGTVDGNIDVAGDHDFYAINLVAGQTYIFRTAATMPVDATDTVLTLRSASGTQILTNDDAGQSSFSAIRYTATSSGTFYLDVSAFGNKTGAFNLTAFTAQTPVAYTYDQIAEQLTNGYWGSNSHHFAVSPGGSLTFNVQALTAEGQTLARAATALWGDVIGITLNEVTSGGQIVYDDSQTGAFASSSYSGGITTSANVNVSSGWLTTYGTSLNSYSFQTYVHETGHALGLGHAGNYNNAAAYDSDSLYLNDSWATTVMSYFDQTENTYFQAQGFSRQYVVTPMLGDVVAVANLYGANTLTRTGNTTYGFGNTSGRDIYDATLFTSVSYTIYDNGGIDTLDYSGFGQNQTINLNPETFSNVGGKVGNVSIARGSVIENAIGGTGSDTIIGNAAANVLTGGLGNDTLRSGGGADTLNGGSGNDRLELSAGSDGTTADGGADFDVLAVIGATGIGAMAGIESVELSGSGVLTLTNAQFSALMLASIPVGGTGGVTVNMAPATPLIAMSLILAPGASIAFTANGTSGIDVIKANLATTNTLNGGDDVDQIRGGNLADTIIGGNGDDKLLGIGGADLLTGGAGADQFRYLYATDSGLGAAADHITDFVAGTDKIDLRLFDANSVTPGQQAVSYIGTAAFHATGGAEVHHLVSGGNQLVEIDLDGNGSADWQIVLDGAGAQVLGAGDFLI